MPLGPVAGAIAIRSPPAKVYLPLREVCCVRGYPSEGDAADEAGDSARSALATGKLKRELGLRDLVLFYVVSGLSLRWIATAAATGPSALGVWLLAWLGFFLPLAGCVLELSSRYSAEGGLYVWTQEAFGPFPAFMSAWTYWMSNLPYFPAVLFFAASSLLFAG